MTGDNKHRTAIGRPYIECLIANSRPYIKFFSYQRSCRRVAHLNVKFEIKYIKQSDYQKEGQRLIVQRKEEAVEQIKKYSTSRELFELPNLKKWVLVFAGNSCVVNMEV